MSKVIAIMGCGWLGLPLARHFISRGFRVHGSTTSQEKMASLLEHGVVPFMLSAEGSGIQGPVNEFLEGVEILIIAIPPGLRKGKGESYLDKIKAIHSAVNQKGVNKLLFVSSTSVYGKAVGKVTEETPPNPVTESGRQILASEQVLQNDAVLQTIIVRFGGLIGPERHPVTSLAGKKDLTNGADPVNLIHLQDCIQLIATVICDGLWNEVFNAVYPAHPAKQSYYARQARKRQLESPEFKASTAKITGKWVISSNYLTRNYSFFTSIF